MAVTPSKRFVPQSIRGRVLSLSLLPLVLSLLASLVMFMLLAVPAILEDQREQLNTTVVSQREFFTQWTEERFSDLRFLSTLLPLDLGEGYERPPEFSSFLDSQAEFNNVGVYRVDGYPAGSDETATINVSDRDYFRRALEGREAFSQLLIGRGSNRPLIVVALPVYDLQEGVRGVLAAAVPISTLLDTLEAAGRVDEGQTVLVDSEGRIISDEVLRPIYAAAGEGDELPLAEIWNRPGNRVSEEVLRRLRTRVSTAGPYVNSRGQRVVAAYQTLIRNDWYLVGESPIEQILGSLRAYVYAGAATIILFLLLFLPLLLRVSRSVERPIMDLAAFSREVNRERYDIEALPRLPEGAPREVRTLFATFSEMVIRLKEHLRDLERIAITDPLTGLANRRFLMSEGQRAIALSIENSQPTSVLMIDIDLFKRINDEFGHDVGDRAIQCAAATIAGTTRDNDLVARFGGEEFTVVSPFTEEEEALQLGERIRLACSSACFFGEEDGRAPFSFTVSVGVATGFADATGARSHILAGRLLNRLIEAADGALYEAKRGGRNRVNQAEAIR